MRNKLKVFFAKKVVIKVLCIAPVIIIPTIIWYVVGLPIMRGHFADFDVERAAYTVLALTFSLVFVLDLSDSLGERSDSFADAQVKAHDINTRRELINDFVKWRDLIAAIFAACLACSFSFLQNRWLTNGAMFRVSAIAILIIYLLVLFRGLFNLKPSDLRKNYWGYVGFLIVLPYVLASAFAVLPPPDMSATTDPCSGVRITATTHGFGMFQSLDQVTGSFSNHPSWQLHIYVEDKNHNNIWYRGSVNITKDEWRSAAIYVDPKATPTLLIAVVAINQSPGEDTPGQTLISYWNAVSTFAAKQPTPGVAPPIIGNLPEDSTMKVCDRKVVTAV